MLLLLVGYVGCIVGTRTRHAGRAVLLALTAGATVQGLYLGLFSYGVFWWHFVSVVPCGILGLAMLIDAGLTRVPCGLRTITMWFAAVSAGVLLVASLGLTLTATSPLGDRLATSGWRVEAQRAAQWAATHLPRNALLAMRDSGAFGYYTVQPVMNLDGVASSYDYERALCHGSVVGAMREASVQYVAYHALPAKRYTSFALPVTCIKTGRRTKLRFSPADEVYRGHEYWQGRAVYFVIWRFDADVQVHRG